MNTRPFWRLGGALLCLLLLPVCAFLFAQIGAYSPPRDPDTCLGLQVLSGSEYGALGGQIEQAPDGLILYHGQIAPCDRASATIYLSVSAAAGSRASDMTGTLAAADDRFRLAFAPDPALEDMAKAISDNHTFTLLAIRQDGGYIPYSVIFTPLPVISIVSGDEIDYSDPYAEHEGSVRVFEAGGAQVSRALWHRRGMSTRLFKKGSWKLSLTNAFGRPKNMAIAGLGSDDDWLLNAMGMDDLRLREKLITTLWNGMQQDAGSALRMADCAYAEVVLDGEYMGLYLLQRRVDSKSLGMDKSRDAVLKGSNNAGAQDASQAFTIKSSPLSAQETAALMQPLYTLGDVSAIDLPSFLDVEAFILFGAMHDNCDIRNTYYILNPRLGGYSVSLLPWDTDLSFGLAYVQGSGHVLLPLEESFSIQHRREFDAMTALYPDLSEQLAARWHALRQSTLSEETVFAALNGITDELAASGAFTRDRALWGTRYGDRDTPERLRGYIADRLAQIDQLYAQ